MQRRRRHDDRAERDLKMLALKTGVIWPQTKECQQSLELEEERNGSSSRTSICREHSLASTYQQYWCWTSGLRNCESINFFVFSHQVCLNLLQAATGNEHSYLFPSSPLLQWEGDTSLPIDAGHGHDICCHPKVNGAFISALQLWAEPHDSCWPIAC